MIYLDNAATTPVDPDVLDAMLPFFTTCYGNPSSNHGCGLAARNAVDDARAVVASALGASPKDITFTSGASEANNLVIKGIKQCVPDQKLHFITTPIEHKAVLEPMRCLIREGHDVTFLPVDANGHINPDDVRRAIRQNTILCSVIWINNETGTVQPIHEIGRICRERGVFFHTDATQGFGKLPVNVDEWFIDALSLSAHKIYGPKGVGALYHRANTPIVCQIAGGSQEDGLRAGTLNVPGIVGLAKATDICMSNLQGDYDHLTHVSNLLIELLYQAVPGFSLNNDTQFRAPWIINGHFDGVDSTALMNSLSPDVCVSRSSACSKSGKPSHVLQAMRLPPHKMRCSVRMSPGRQTTEQEIAEAAELIAFNVGRLRGRGAA